MLLMAKPRVVAWTHINSRMVVTQPRVWWCSKNLRSCKNHLLPLRIKAIAARCIRGNQAIQWPTITCLNFFKVNKYNRATPWFNQWVPQIMEWLTKYRGRRNSPRRAKSHPTIVQVEFPPLGINEASAITFTNTFRMSSSKTSFWSSSTTEESHPIN